MKYTLKMIREQTFLGPSNFQGTSCWFWKTAKDKTVYMTVSHDGKQISLHRLVYTLQHGEISPKGVIDHLCMNKGCCNPSHLELVDHSENIRRAFKKKPRVKKENTKGQITFTLEDEHAKYVQKLAEINYEGNMSMAIRKIIADHSRDINYKVAD